MITSPAVRNDLSFDSTPGDNLLPDFLEDCGIVFGQPRGAERTAKITLSRTWCSRM
jgi:hypothetical protein